MATVVALVGLAGTGKSTAASYLCEQLRAPCIHFGGIVIEEVKRRGLNRGEEAERLVAESIREQLGSGGVARKAGPALVAAANRSEHVVIDGVASVEERDAIEEMVRAKFVTVAIHSPRLARERRMAARPVRPLNALELAARDRREVFRLGKAVPIALADHHVVNDSGLEQFVDQLHRLCDEL